MLTLNDGRAELWQWDTGRILAVDADCSQVHFSNKVFGRSIDVDVVNGIAIIPDILLQTDKDLNVWAFVGTAENGYTKISKTFKVNRRNKPADYVFTQTDQMTLQTIQRQIGDLADLTTEAKDTLVAAINEAARIGGGAGSMDLRVAGGYVQYSRDGGMTWTNLIAMEDLKGDPGEPGKDGHSPVVTATKSGKTTTISVDGASIATVEDGADGKPGTDGADGVTPHIGNNGNWYLGETDTGKPSRGADGVTGATGATGEKGADGKSAYQYAVEGGYTGTEAEFAEKLAQEIPAALPNPNALTFTGAVSATYDGSAPLSVEIPSGGGGEWETAIDTTFTESAYLDTGEMPGKTEMLCVFAVPKSDSNVTLSATSAAFGKSISGFAMGSASYGKIGVIYAKKICGHAIAYAGSGDTTSTNPKLETSPRVGVNLQYYRITTNITDIPLKLTSALPAGTIIKVFVR